MRQTTGFFLGLLVMCAGCSRGPSGDVTEPPTASADLKDPRQSQIERGARLFGQHCASCHGDQGQGGAGPLLVGEGALPRTPPAPRVHRTGEFADVGDVFDFVRATMPPNDPGVISADDAWAILAFDLSANGIALETPLNTNSASTLPLQ